MAETFGLTDPNIIQEKKPKQITIMDVKQQTRSPSPEIKMQPQPVQQQQQQLPPKKDELEMKEEKEADRKNRKWQNILKRISFAPGSETHYQKYPVRPGFGLYKALVQATKFDNCFINLPETLMVLENGFIYMFTDSKTGELRKKQDANWNEFEKKVIEEHKQLSTNLKNIMINTSEHRKFNDKITLKELYEKVNPELNQEVPLIISRGPGTNDWMCSKLVYSYRAQKERKPGSETNKIEQRFVLSRPLKATMFRLVYQTRNSQNQKANYAYRIMNSAEIFDPNPKKSATNKATINTINANSFDIQLVKGSGLRSYEIQAEQLVQLLERNNNIRIKTIVLDFIQDIEGKVWLINCKAIDMDLTIQMSEYLAGKSDDNNNNNNNNNNQQDKGKKTLDQLTCSVYCKLCGIIFKKDDASKVLTYKLLWELVQHLKKRNIQLKNIKVSHSSTRPCRVCNLCYMLVVGEHELIEIEQKFARAQNIPIHDAVIRVPIDQKPKHRPALLSEKLYQWRLIFYFGELKNIGAENAIDYNNVYFQYKLHNFRTYFKINFGDNGSNNNNDDQNNSQNKTNIHGGAGSGRPSTGFQQQQFPNLHRNASAKTTYGAKSNYNTAGGMSSQEATEGQVSGEGTQTGGGKKYNSANINHIRVHYFFSEDDNIEKFIQDTEIKMRLTCGPYPDWNTYFAEGSSKTISHFNNKMKGGQRHSSQVLLFFESAKYCVLTLNAGLSCDGEYNTAKFNLYKYNNIYFPDESYYNSNKFPDEWMEMFDPSYVANRDELNETKGTEKYSPKCSASELNKMIDFNSYKSKNKYKGVESKIKTLFRAQSATTMMNNLNSIKPASQQQIQSQQQQQQFPQSIGQDSFKMFASPTNFAAGNVSNDQQQQYSALGPQTQKHLPPRAMTAKSGGDDFDLLSRKRPETGVVGRQQYKTHSQQYQQQQYQKQEESQRFLLDQKIDEDEKRIYQQYDLFSGEEDNDSGEEIIQQKLRNYYNNQNISKDNQEQDKSDRNLSNSPLNADTNNRKSKQPENIQPVGQTDYKNFLSEQKRKITGEQKSD